MTKKKKRRKLKDIKQPKLWKTKILWTMIHQCQNEEIQRKLHIRTKKAKKKI